MKDSRALMGMPITVEIVDSNVGPKDLDFIFDYFAYVDEKFSTYKNTSEISAVNQGTLKEQDYSEDMKLVLQLSEETKNLTSGYFDIKTAEGKLDPSGLVKGWAINNAALLLESRFFKNFYVEAGGDIAAMGKNVRGDYWSIGIRNPFKREEIVKTIYLKNNEGVATSGSYIRGQHIYNPFDKQTPITEIVSLTVIGPNVYEADRFATAAFAMGKSGIDFIEKQRGLEGYIINKDGIATMTSGFEKYTQ